MSQFANGCEVRFRVWITSPPIFSNTPRPPPSSTSNRGSTHYEWLHNLRNQQWSGQSCQDFENISNSNLSQRIFYDSHVSQTCSAKRNSNMCCRCNVYHNVCLVLVTSVQLCMALFVYSCKLYTVVYKHDFLKYRVFFFTGSAQKVLSMELVPPNSKKND